VNQGRIKFQYPVYPDLTLLPRDNKFYACWYYYTLAQKLSEMLGDGSTESQFGILEGEPWLDPRYEQIARSVALMYGFDNPGPFMEDRIWVKVEEQAVSIGLPRPHYRIKKPLKLVLLN
jgi:hypothetical protein